MPVSPQFRPSVAHSPDGGGYLFPTVSSPQTQMPSPELAIPILGHMQTADPPTMSFLELKLTIKDILLALITEERSPSRHEKNPETLALLMWSISVLAFEEMIGCQRPVKEVVDDCINTLLDHLTVTNLKVVHAAADALTLFAHNYKLVNYLDKPILQGVVEKIVGALTEQMLFQHGLTSKQVRGYLASRLLYCLLEWVMILPPDLWAVPKVAHMVFEVIENALSASDGGHGSVGSGSESDRSIQSSVRKPRMSIHEAAPFLVNTAMGTREGSSSFPRDRRSMMISDGKPTATDRAEVSATTNGLNQPTAKSSFDDQDGDSNLIMETAENVLTHIIHHVNNFAQPCGAAMLGSQLIDPALTEDPGKDGERYLYFTYNKTTLITVIDMPGRTPLDSRARLIIRDMTGRYSWDTYLFYEDLQKMRLRTEQQTSLHLSDESMDDAPARFDADPCQYQGIVSALKLADDISFEENVRRFVPDPVTYVREQGTMPEWKENTGVETADMLDELLQYIGTAHPDCLLRDSTPLNVPPELHAPARDAVGEMGKQLQRQIDAERQCAEFFVNDSLGETVQRIHVTNGEARRIEPHPPPVDMTTESSNPPRRRATVPHVQTSQRPLSQHSQRESILSESVEPTKSYIRVKPGPHPHTATPYQRARLLLSHLGHVDFDGLKFGSFHMLGKTPALYRDIKVLDRKHGRETIKLAIIYVAPGQEDEQSIFRNEHGSVEYEEFVSSLGWEIDLATHPGFLGGLERSLANGSIATYYCTSTLEMLFHDVTKMPTDPNDPKQLKKKRHIGNDHVHIVWNEHHREYRRGTIGGDFGNAQIIITPRTDGLFSVEVLRDAKVPSFGPLHNQMVVNKKVLGPLVRQTALNAYRAALAIGDPMQKQNKHVVGIPLNRHAFVARREDIKTIAERHKVAKWTFERFVESVFATGAEGIVGQVENTAGSNAGLSGSSPLGKIVSGLVA